MTQEEKEKTTRIATDWLGYQKECITIFEYGNL